MEQDDEKSDFPRVPTSIRFTKLKDETNYQTWQSNCRMALELHGLWDIVDGRDSGPVFDEPEPKEPAPLPQDATEAQQLQHSIATEAVRRYNLLVKQHDKKMAAYRQRVAYAAIIIKTSLEDGPHNRVIDSTDPIHIWTHLKTAYSQRGVTSEIILKKKMTQTIWDGVTSFTAFWDNFVADCQRVKQMDTGLRDRDICIWALSCMPSQFNSVTGQMSTSIKEFTPTTLDDIIAQYTQEYTRQKANADQDALMVRVQRPQRSNFPPCEHCQRSNHLSINCWTKYPEKKPERFKRTSDSQDNKENENPNKKTRQNLSYAKETVLVAEILDTLPETDQQPFTYQDATCNITEVEFVRGKDFDEDAMKAIDNHSIQALSLMEVIDRPFFVDSACTRHMCCQMDRMVNLRMLDKPIRVRVGGNHILLATHIGQVYLSLDVYGNSANPMLNDVLYVPGLGANLISVRVCVAKYLRVSFFRAQGSSTSVCEITDSSGRVFLTASEHGQQFVINTDCTLTEATHFTSASPYAYAELACLNTEVDDTILDQPNGTISKSALLHRILGHQSLDKMRMMGHKVSDYGVCEPCIMAKSKRQRSTTPAQQSKGTCLNDLIHIDTAGPITPAGMFGGALYFALFTDDFTRTRTGTAVVKRDEVPAKFKDFNTRETLNGNPVRRCRTDNAGEFVSKKFTGYCNSVGIKMENSSDRTPEQNGVAERSIGILSAMMRACLFTAGAPPGLWPQVMEYGLDVLDITPTSALNGLTPFEARTGQKPAISHLHVWGCTCHVLTKEKRKKLDSLTTPHIFLGYVTKDGSIYKVMNARTLYVRQARDLKFLDNDFSAMAILRSRCGYSTEKAMLAVSNMDFECMSHPCLQENSSSPFFFSPSSLFMRPKPKTGWQNFLYHKSR